MTKSNMKYPTFRIDGKKIQVNQPLFDWLYNRIKKSITFDNQENKLELSKKDVELLSWNSAVMAYHQDLDFINSKPRKENYEPKI